ncbi:MULTISPECIES: AtpZ/AtpI family protein [unclassified Lebetimonas]|uniref:AtpZ/AtpI family protein n=1 Tax=unclassified Lebetimonas TaxID=2648158 RepID=UPI000463F577|nr:MULTISPECIES: AtpZ/AtpI family protein [unclassified Lebetimonas]
MQKKGNLGKTVRGAEKLSLGISIVVAVLMGVGIGLWLKNTFHQIWLLWLGVFWGIAAAILNIKKEYDKLKKEWDKIKNDPRYKNYKINKKEDEDEDDYLENFEK